MFKKNKSVTVGIAVITIIVMLWLFGYAIVHVHMGRMECSYEGVSVYINYPESNISKDEAIALLMQERNLTILAIYESVMAFKMTNTSLSNDTLARIECVLIFPDKFVGRNYSIYRNYSVYIEYHSQNASSRLVYSQQEKKEWIQHAEENYSKDKGILEPYIRSVAPLINKTIGVGYSEIKWAERPECKLCE